MKRLCIAFLSFLLMSQANSQNLKVSGTVSDEANEPICYCNITFRTPQDSSLVVGCIADMDGKWEVEIPKGKYLLGVSYVGYTPYNEVTQINSNMVMPNINLSVASHELQELVITGRKKVRTANADIYFLGNSPKTIGRNALEVVSLAAGVSVDKRKGLKIYGKEGVRVMVNNRQLDLKGDELSKYLANLRGEDIQTVEVVSLADASQSAEANGGLIRIKLKSQAVNGYDIGVGIIGQAYGKDFIGVRPDISFNSKINKFNIYGNLHYSSIGNRKTDTENSIYINSKDNLTTSSVVNNKLTLREWFYRFGTMYDIDDKQSLGLDIDGTFSRLKEHINTPSQVSTNGNITNYQANYFTPDSIQKFNISLNYRRRVNDLGSELAIGADYYSSSDNSSEHNHLYSIDSNENYSVKTEGTTRYNQKMYTTGLDYKWVLSPSFTLNVGGKYNFTRMKNNLNNNEFVNGKWGVDKENTDNFIYDETIRALYANGSLKLGKWDLMAGVRYEGSTKDTKSTNFPARTEKKTYNDFFPVLSTTFNFNEEKGHSLTFKTKAGIARPSFDELIPYSTQQNLYTYLVGNPFLSPSYTYSGGIDLLLFRGLYFGLDYTHKKDMVELVLQQPDPNSPRANAYYENIPKIDSYMFNSYLPAPICDWLFAGLEFSVGKKKREFSNSKDEIWQIAAGLEVNITLAKDWFIELYGSGINKDYYGNMLLKNYYTADLSLKKSFMNNKLQLSFNGVNIFGKKKSLEIRGGSIDRNLLMKAADDCRNFNISLRYSFGGKNKVEVDKVKAMNTEDRER